MGLMKWDPFNDLLSLQERMNRLFEESLGRATGGEQGATVTSWSPAVDILEEKDEIILRAELPGIALEDVDLQIKDDVLVLRGERQFEQEAKKENYHRVERAYGAFSRSFKLPSIVDRDKIKAKLKDGILEVVLPKTRKIEPRSIPIGPKTS